MEARLPRNESARLESLRCYQILDTPPEREFDDITFLASKLCEVPIALISLIDSDRQWFKSGCGIDAAETPRNVSFCAHAILEPDRPLVVTDPLHDPRFSDNPQVVDGDIKFYAGIPLQTEAGIALGTLCVVDHRPRELTAAQIAGLEALARQVISQLELRKASRELDEARLSMHEQERADSLRRIIMDVAHQLNNPLTSIGLKVELTRAVAERLRSPGADVAAAADEITAHQDTVRLNAQRLAGLAGSLRDLMRERPPTDEVVDGALALEAAVQAARKRHASASFLVKASAASAAGCRQEDVARVLAALLDNAVESMAARPLAPIQASVAVDAGEVVFTVRDAGSGIPEAERDHVFRPFHTTKPGGSGCSLAIAKRIAEAAGGSLGFVTGDGSTFSFRLPLA